MPAHNFVMHQHCGTAALQVAAVVAPEEAVRALQAMLPPTQKAPPTVEMENVSPALLLPPAQLGGSSIAVAQTGGHFDLGDRVVFVGAATGMRLRKWACTLSALPWLAVKHSLCPCLHPE